HLKVKLEIKPPLPSSRAEVHRALITILPPTKTHTHTHVHTHTHTHTPHTHTPHTHTHTHTHTYTHTHTQLAGWSIEVWMTAMEFVLICAQNTYSNNSLSK